MITLIIFIAIALVYFTASKKDQNSWKKDDDYKI